MTTEELEKITKLGPKDAKRRYEDAGRRRELRQVEKDRKRNVFASKPG